MARYWTQDLGNNELRGNFAIVVVIIVLQFI